MEQVYSNAYCNIAAAAARDSRVGCFIDRDVKKTQPTIVHVPARPRTLLTSASAVKSHNIVLRQATLPECSKFYTPGVYTCEEDDVWDREVTNSVLGRRAWVFQERLLAKRVLHFTSNQVFFECCSIRATETYPMSIQRLQHVGQDLKRDFADALDSMSKTPQDRQTVHQEQLLGEQ